MDNYKKLAHCMWYAVPLAINQATVDTLEGEVANIIKWWVDGALQLQ
jgi:hypothetical protein